MATEHVCTLANTRKMTHPDYVTARFIQYEPATLLWPIHQLHGILFATWQ